jgi:two-component system sensor histidine kinase RegB
MRPDVRAAVRLPENQSEFNAQFHPTIAQAIINLLNNAADASPEDIEIDIHWSTEKLYWTIKDGGAGIAEEVTAHLGKSFVSTKAKGLGIGLMLTQATINRYGGTVSLHKREPQGTITQLEFPITLAPSIEPHAI